VKKGGEIKVKLFLIMLKRSRLKQVIVEVMKVSCEIELEMFEEEVKTEVGTLFLPP
jgi:hypothetical protein